MPNFSSVAEEALAHSSPSLFGRLTPADLGTIRSSALDAGTKTVVGLSGLGAVAIGRDKLRQRAQAKQEDNMDESFRQVLEKNPGLAAHDPERVKDYYSMLRQFAPGVAAHPHASGSWLTAQLRYGDEHVPFSSIQDLINAQKAHEETVGGRLGVSSVQALASGVPMLPKFK